MQDLVRPGCRLAVLFVLYFNGQCYSQPAVPNASPECTPALWMAPTETGGTGVQAILKDVPITTRWADLPAATKARLRQHAEDRLAAFRARWGGEAIAKKDTILRECPTPEMRSAIDEFYRARYSALVPEQFSLNGVTSNALKRALVSNYLGTIAAQRATLTYPNGDLKNIDWDGKSPFDSIRLPDHQSFEAIKQFNARIVQDLNRIDDAGLVDPERALKQRVLFGARARAVGAFSGDSKGGADMQSACEVVDLINGVLMGYKGDRGRPKIFANDDEVLREVNAAYLHNTTLRWLDMGTLNSAVNFGSCNYSSHNMKYVGDPSTDEVAKGITLLKSWWIERVSASPEARNKCSVYSVEDRAQIWEAFSADQLFNNDGSSSMETYKARLDAYREKKSAQYRGIARRALQQAFPDDAVLTPAQRQHSLTRIDKESEFGLFIDKIAAILDEVQGSKNGAAAMTWNSAVAANVKSVGGGYADKAPVRAEDRMAINAMYEEVKSWVARRYQDYPIDFPRLFGKFQLTLDTGSNATTSTSTGDITLGVGTKRSRMEYYSLLIHELRHAVNFAWQADPPDKSNVASDIGPALEGSGVAVEELLLAPFLRETLKDETALALYALDYGIRDARFVGTTDATLQRYFREGCSGADDKNTIEFIKDIAAYYGLTGNLAETATLRAHAGTQYFQYIWSGQQVLDDIAYLQAQIDPSGKRNVDPFVLFACGLNTPQRSATYIRKLEACLRP